jgi:hypothetical protein
MNISLATGAGEVGTTVLNSALSASFLPGIRHDAEGPDSVKGEANVQLAGGIPFRSALPGRAALDEANVSAATAVEAIVAENGRARLDGLCRAFAGLAITGLLGLIGRRVPTRQPGAFAPDGPR